MSKKFQELMKEITDWQDSVFTKATPLSAAEHLRREVRELLFDLANGNPESAKTEMADCQLLLFAVAHLSGVDLEQAIEEKMIVNRRRVWGAPDDQGVVEHVRDPVYLDGRGRTLIEVFEDVGLFAPTESGSENILIQISKGEINGQVQID